MTLGLLVLIIFIVALVLTGLTGVLGAKVESWPITFLQHFTGALFVFSGAVKAVDPLGTAYKMSDYFAAFEGTLEPTWFGFLAPAFTAMNEYAVAFSVSMIVLEIVLGIMLLLGAWRRFSSWAFLLLVGFFTLLTGFTYLTGYVPSDVNFFQFGQWGPFVETNMKVTDCGCFGDFLKLKPRTSFLKDIALLVPALLFVRWWPAMHQLFAPGTRYLIIGLSVPALLLYCLSNFVWNLPDIDFRAFREGVHVRERLNAENEAQAAVEVIGYRLTEKAGGRVVELPLDQYLAEFKNYPKSDWELEQIQSEPSVELTKISDFVINQVDGGSATDQILGYPGFSLMVVAYTLHGEPRGESYAWTPAELQPWTERVNPVLAEAEAAGIRTLAVVGGAGADKIEAFRHASQSAYPFYVADDILLKTIIRSNPGVVLWQDGAVVKKWHVNKLPDFERIQQDFLSGR